MPRRTPTDTRAQRGHDRAAHFAAGGDLASWRGRAAVIPDARKEAARRACRGPTTLPPDDGPAE
jgi:hypothetical protein